MLGNIERRLVEMEETFGRGFQKMEENQASPEIKNSPDVLRKIDAASVRCSGDAEQEGIIFEHGTDSEIFYGTSSDTEDERDSSETEEVLDSRLNATSGAGS